MECLQTLEGHSSIVNSVSFSQDGTKVASGSWDNTVKMGCDEWGMSADAGGAFLFVTSVSFLQMGRRLRRGLKTRR